MSTIDTRERLANSLQAYLESQIGNDSLDETLSDPDVRGDKTCMEIAFEMELFLSDFRHHKNEGRFRIPAVSEQAIQRWIYLLRTGWEWSPSRADSTRFGFAGLLDLLWSNFRMSSRLASNLYWPLSGEEEWTNWTATAELRKEGCEEQFPKKDPHNGDHRS